MNYRYRPREKSESQKIIMTQVIETERVYKKRTVGESKNTDGGEKTQEKRPFYNLVLTGNCGHNFKM